MAVSLCYLVLVIYLACKHREITALQTSLSEWASKVEIHTNPIRLAREMKRPTGKLLESFEKDRDERVYVLSSGLGCLYGLAVICI